MHLDVESGQPLVTKSQERSCATTCIKRKWKSIPRIARLYLTIGLIVTIFLIVILYLPKSEPLVEINDRPTKSQFSLITEESVRKPSNEQLIKPLIDTKITANNDINTNDNNINNNINDNINEIKEWTPNGKRMMGTIDSLNLKIFRESAQKHQNKEQIAIAEALKHSWNAYKTYAWGADNLRPITKTKHNWFSVGLTILDSMDTLIVMGLEEEFNLALNWVKNDLRFDIFKEVNCFEMTIRALAGLLSAYHLSNEPTLLIRAADLGERLIHCFDSPQHLVPFSDVNLRTRTAKTPNWSPDSSLSEVTTVQLEFRDLTYLTGINKYEKMSFRTSEHIHNLTAQSGKHLLPMYINPYTGQFSRGTITLGARGDSYYEYLLKQYIQTGIQWLKEDYVKAMDELQKRLVRTTKGPLKLTFVGEILRTASFSDVHPKMDHLVCFLSGTLALGYYKEVVKSPKIRGHSVTDDSKFAEHLVLAEKLGRTCNYMYNLTKTGLSPEIAYFDESGNEDELQIRPADAHNLLRPEFVESLFYLYHITGKQIYRTWGWRIFQAFEKYSRVSSGGYTSIDDVRNPDNVRPKDMMESFWFAETLKYLYLLFCDDKQIVTKLLDSYIFNSEGHLIPVRTVQ